MPVCFVVRAMFSGSASTVQSHLPCCVIVEGFGRPSREGRQERRGSLLTFYVCWGKTATNAVAESCIDELSVDRDAGCIELTSGPSVWRRKSKGCFKK